MPISGQTAIEMGLVADFEAQNIKQASYDLSVGEIIAPNVDQQRIEIKPQQMFTIISKESIKMPKSGYVAYVLPKTGLCQEGIFVLNTGIIDPNYSGPISTTAINFSNHNYHFRLGDSFARVTFHKIAEPLLLGQNRVEYNREKYKQDRVKNADRFPEFFLNINGHMDAMAEAVLEKSGAIISKRIIFLVTLFLLAIGIISYCMPLIVNSLPKLLPDGYHLTGGQGEIITRITAIESDNAKLKALVNELDTERKMREPNTNKNGKRNVGF